jgi:hypothetical protein
MQHDCESQVSIDRGHGLIIIMKLTNFNLHCVLRCFELQIIFIEVYIS